MRTRSSLFLYLLLAFAAGAGVAVVLRMPGAEAMPSEASAAPPAGQAEHKTQTYYCPMHPSYRSDHPGNCPVCNMKLIPLEKRLDDGTDGNAGGRGKIRPRLDVAKSE